MKVCNYLDVKPIQVTPGVVKREVITAADGAPNFFMRVFEVEPSGSTPPHSHPEEHEIFILSGRGVVFNQGKETPIARDTVIFVAPNEHHYFLNNGDEPLRFINLIPLLT